MHPITKIASCSIWSRASTGLAVARSISTQCCAARRDAHWSRRAQKHVKLHYSWVHAMIWLRMTKNWYITDCYVQLIFCHTESNLCMNSRVMEFRMFLSSPGSVCATPRLLEIPLDGSLSEMIPSSHTIVTSVIQVSLSIFVFPRARMRFITARITIIW